MNFELGGITIPIQAALDFSQTYESIGGSIMHRMQSGRAIKQTHYKKLRTVLSGEGWVPAGLDGLNYDEPLLLRCAAPRSCSSTTSQKTIPLARRQDLGFEPKGYAVLGGELHETPIKLQANIAILDPIADASSYQVQYYPEIWVFAEPVQTQTNLTGAEFVWSLVCEEI